MNQTGVNKLDKLTTQKLIMLIIGSVLLCLSLLMSVFTPYPLILAITMFGRVKGISMSVLGLIGVSFLGVGFFQNGSVFGVYLCSLIFAVAISEIIMRKLNPMRSMIIFGFGFNAFIFGVIMLASLSSGISVKDYIVKEIEANDSIFQEMRKSVESADSMNSERLEFLSVLNEPELLAKQMIEQVPAYLFIGIFFTLWVNMYLTLNVRNIMGRGLTSFTVKDLMTFRVPDQVIWVVIGSLVMAVWGGDIGYTWLEPVGVTFLKCLGVFYFFQGFGIYVDFLNFFKVKGFLRTFLIVITVLSANQVVAIIGLFDMFINFRKFFRSKK